MKINACSNFCFDFIEVLQPNVAAVLTAEYADFQYLRDIQLLKPPLQEVTKPKAEIAETPVRNAIIH
jgi:hypothetical protein